MPQWKHSGKLCRLTKGGMARAPENAPVCNMGGLASARPAGEGEQGTVMPQWKHGGKLCRLTKGGTARAQETAAVRNKGGLSLDRPVGEMKRLQTTTLLTAHY